MALQMVGTSDLRKYNPERDMLWALHRFFKSAFVQFKEGDNDTLAELMRRHGIKVPVCDLKENMSLFIKETVAAIADPMLKETRNPGKKAEELLLDLFADRNDGHTAIRTLFAVMFFRAILAELPTWAAMARPRNPNEPIPGNEEVATAAYEFITRLDGITSAAESDGEAARD